MREKFQILGVDIDVVNLSLAWERIHRWVTEKTKVYICVVPVSTIISCQENPSYKDVINQADMATPDGMPVVWLGKMFGHKLIERTYGPDLMRNVCRQGVSYQYKHFFYGSTPEVLKKLVARLTKDFPGLMVAGQYSPPFEDQVHPEEESIIGKINQSKADILWVGLGAPKQDFWMVQNRNQINVPVMIGIGAAFDFLSGVKKQAPGWMQRVGLEWFFRLWCEPRRLWKRYLIGNSKFIGYLIRDLFRKSR